MKEEYWWDISVTQYLKLMKEGYGIFIRIEDFETEKTWEWAMVSRYSFPKQLIRYLYHFLKAAKKIKKE